MPALSGSFGGLQPSTYRHVRPPVRGGTLLRPGMGALRTPGAPFTNPYFPFIHSFKHKLLRMNRRPSRIREKSQYPRAEISQKILTGPSAQGLGKDVSPGRNVFGRTLSRPCPGPGGASDISRGQALRRPRSPGRNDFAPAGATECRQSIHLPRPQVKTTQPPRFPGGRIRTTISILRIVVVIS